MRRFLASIVLVCLGVCGCSDDAVNPVDPPAERPSVDHVTRSSDYLNNRFFRLDLPETESRGRQPGETILPASIRVYQLMGLGQPGPNDIRNVAAYVDSTGFRDWATIDFSQPAEWAWRWRYLVDLELLLDPDGTLVAVDVGSSLNDEDVLAVTYTVVAPDGSVVARIGDVPGQDPPTQAIPGDFELYYRMKLLKATLDRPREYLYHYVLRNIYSLGGANLDATQFSLRIEARDPGLLQPDREESGITYLRIFGLDSEGPAGEVGADGIADLNRHWLFDLEHGLLRFPLDFPRPFWDESGTGDRYRQNTGYDPAFVFPDTSSFLSRNQADQFLYNPAAQPVDFPKEAFFDIIASYPDPDLGE